MRVFMLYTFNLYLKHHNYVVDPQDMDQEYISHLSLDCLCQAGATSWSGGLIETQD